MESLLLSTYLLFLGFVVGFSGAMIPGPLLVFVISDTLKKGRWSGPLAIMGHALVELFIVVLIFYGLYSFIQDYGSWIYLLGGLMLAYMSYLLYRDSSSYPDFRLEEKAMNRKLAYGSILGGIIFTLFNPSFPLWWATAGSALILEGMKQLGYVGMVLVVVGHWGSDLFYYSFISSLISRGREDTLKKAYQPLMIILAFFLAFLAVYFIDQGLNSTGILSPILL
ncbi:MAG: lysine transporter LysE [Candidatus Altiarchaeales archaeon ex4484_2]|nr:MAG: lysine transporter LysE [Candidatus Altiarchaeales archaeon ex4484_2]